MPRGNGMGPMGMGPMTGRGAGYCKGFTAPSYVNQAGISGGCGYGRGHRSVFYATGVPGWARFGYVNPAESTSSYDEKAFLNNQAEFLENQLQQIKSRLSCLNDKAE